MEFNTIAVNSKEVTNYYPLKIKKEDFQCRVGRETYLYDKTR